MEWSNEAAVAAVERMQQRASCRNFSDKTIPEDVLKTVIGTGIRAATGGNLQPYSIIVVKDIERRRKLAALNEDQKFILDAPVSLVFVLDFSRNGRLAKLQRAPYVAYKSYMHFLISLEDVMCTAQAIETAAWMFGVGSVYAGTSNHKGKEIAEMLELPDHTYPVVILSMGYPKSEIKTRGRLPYDAVVFEEKYKELTDDQLIDAYKEKYGKLNRELSNIPNMRKEILETLKINLLTTYSKNETEEIIDEIQKNNSYGEFMYRFGLHYEAAGMLELSAEVLDQMKAQGIMPFENK